MSRQRRRSWAQGSSPSPTEDPVLDPSQKLEYFWTHWNAELQVEVPATVEKIFECRWLKLRQAGADQLTVQLRKKAKLSKLLAVGLVSDSDDDDAVPSTSNNESASAKPWLADLGKYMDAVDELPEDTLLPLGRVVGYSSQTLSPSMGILGLDYFANQVVAVSSERAFPGGGVTVVRRARDE
ncbi:hypothetical protein B0H19DRAFT_1062772 [Mycena capillaripes]|nr:hypothetical protein B0H19DRAFT_1062772 [Mycena capillaripes]